MDISLATEYLVLILISSFSTIQIASSVKNKSQIRILKNKKETVVLAVILIILSYWWFFATRDRSTQSYMEGVQIAVIFVIGAFLSLLLTKIIKKIYEYN